MTETFATSTHRRAHPRTSAAGDVAKVIDKHTRKADTTIRYITLADLIAERAYARLDQRIKEGEQQAREQRKAQRERYKREGATQRGIPADYAGDNPHPCNARTQSGRPCRALALKNGRCKWHGGMSTGAKTPESRARCAEALHRARNHEHDCPIVSDGKRTPTT